MSISDLERWWHGVEFCQLLDGRIVGIIPFAFTYAIVSNLDSSSYRDRWCYKSLCDAKGALSDWVKNQEFMLEPTGWIRHPSTGRRVLEKHCEVRF